MNKMERMEALLAGHVLKVGSTLYRLDNVGNLEHMNSTRVGWEADEGMSVLSPKEASIADDYNLTFSQAIAMMAEGKTVTSLYQDDLVYTIEGGEVMETYGDGTCDPVEYFPVDMMFAPWRVVG